MAKKWSGEDEELLLDKFDDMMMKEALSGKFDVSMSTIERIDRLSRRTGRKRGAKEDPLKKYGYVVRAFILENIKGLNYRDIARLVGIPEEELKDEVEKAGIKVTEKNVPRWEDLDIQVFETVAACARCQVQCRHSTFLVGYRDCRKCIEENIRHWIDEDHLIRLSFTEMD